MNGSTKGKSILSTGVMPCLPAVSVWSAPNQFSNSPPTTGQLLSFDSSSPLTAMRPMISPNASVTIAM